MAGNYTRQSRNIETCAERPGDFVVSPGEAADLTQTSGPAVLRGPRCRVGTDWDTASPGLNLLSFVIGNGRHEALQFDGQLNDVRELVCVAALVWVFAYKLEKACHRDLLYIAMSVRVFA